jgi:hypothetical protein
VSTHPIIRSDFVLHVFGILPYSLPPHNQSVSFYVVGERAIDAALMNFAMLRMDTATLISSGRNCNLVEEGQ